MPAGITLTVNGSFQQLGGETTLAPGGTLAVLGSLQQDGGTVTLNAATLRANGGYSLGLPAVLQGTGTVVADVVNSGSIYVAWPGQTGSLHIAADAGASVAGNYTQTSTGRLYMELLNTAALDQLFIDGMATFGGNYLWRCSEGRPQPGRAST